MARERNIRLLLEYDGTRYHGWQRQNNALSIQQVLEEALARLTGEQIRLIGSGRTDAGVHALGQVANFHTGGAIPLGYVVGLASIVSGIMANTWLWPAPAVLAAILALGLALGLCNGLITQFMRVPAFIATLGAGYVLYGLAQIVSQGSIINRLPKGFLAIGRTPMFGLPSAVFLALGVAVVFHLLISRTIFGRQLKAFGFGARAAVLSGVPGAQINVSVYALCATLAALSGLLFTIRVNAAQPNMGGGAFTFEVVTAAIVGGTSLFGGVGSVVNSILYPLSWRV